MEDHKGESTVHRTIDAPDLETAMRWFVSNLEPTSPAHFFLSTDHSPAEVIGNHEWHHSVLVLSQNVEHQQLADELGNELNRSSGKLRQWAGQTKNAAYKRSFHNRLFHSLRKYPVLIYVISARQNAVLQHEAALAQALQIGGNYRRISVGDKPKVVFGPFNYFDGGPEQTLEVSEKFVPMAIHLAHTLLRVHTSLQYALIMRDGNTIPNLLFQVMSDRPPSDFTGPYADLMYLLLAGAPTNGKFTWGGFTGGEDQPIDLLADNIAGLIREITSNPSAYQYEGPPLDMPIKGVFYWERFE